MKSKHKYTDKYERIFSLSLLKIQTTVESTMTTLPYRRAYAYRCDTCDNSDTKDGRAELPGFYILCDVVQY